MRSDSSVCACETVLHQKSAWLYRSSNAPLVISEVELLRGRDLSSKGVIAYEKDHDTCRSYDCIDCEPGVRRGGWLELRRA